MADNPYELAAQQATSGNPYEDAASKASIQQHPEEILKNVLQRAASSAMPAVQGMMSSGIDIQHGPGVQFGNEFKKQMFGWTPMSKDSPTDLLPNAKGVGDYFKDAASDPRTLEDAGVVDDTLFKPIGNKISEGFKNNKLANSVNENPILQSSARSQIEGKFKARTVEFDNKLNELTAKYPDQTYDISDTVDKALTASKYNPEVAQRIQNSPDFRAIAKNRIDHPEMPSEVNIQQFQDLRNSFSKGFKFGRGDSTVNDIIGDMRTQHAEPFPDEMGAMNKDYKDTVDNYNVLKPYISEHKMTSSIQQGFKNPEIRARLQAMVDPDTYNKIVGASKGAATQKALSKNAGYLGRVGERVAEVGLLGKILKH